MGEHNWVVGSGRGVVEEIFFIFIYTSHHIDFKL